MGQLRGFREGPWPRRLRHEDHLRGRRQCAMTAATIEAPDVEQEFRNALQADAGAAPAPGQPSYPAPPRQAVSADPDAPRVTSAPPASESTPGAGGPDYREDLTGLGMSVWLAGSALRGGKLWILPLPDARPYAAVWRQAMPGMVEAWNVAAQKNPAVRGYVEKLAGDGSWSWVIGVAVTAIPLAAGCGRLARDPEARAAAADANDAMMEEFMAAQLQAMGLAGQDDSEAA